MAKKKSQEKRRHPRDQRRHADGTIAPGYTLNPGGMSKAVVEFRRMALLHVPRAIERARELLDSPDAYAVDVALRHLLGRALGKESPPLELPDDTPARQSADQSPGALLARTMALMDAGLGRMESQVKDGVSLSAEAHAQLGTYAAALKTLAAVEDGVKERAGLSGLSDEEVRAKLLETFTPDQLWTEMQRRAGNKGHPDQGFVRP